MGITIYYELSQKGTEEDIQRCMRYINETAKSMGFSRVSDVWSLEYRDNDSVDDTTVKSEDLRHYEYVKTLCSPYFDIRKKSKYIEKNGTEKWTKYCKKHNGYGGLLQWRKNSSPLVIGFVRTSGRSKTWTSNLHIKTLWDENFSATHVSACSILRVCEKADILKSIYDESGFYDFDDFTYLIDEGIYSYEFMNKMFNKMKRLFSSCAVGGSAKTVENRLKDIPNIGK